MESLFPVFHFVAGYPSPKRGGNTVEPELLGGLFLEAGDGTLEICWPVFLVRCSGTS